MNEVTYWRSKFLRDYEQKNGINLGRDIEEEFLRASKNHFFGRTPESFLESLIKTEAPLYDDE